MAIFLSHKMGGLGSYKPALAMVASQCIYAGIALFSKAAFEEGLKPTMFVFYRQAMSTIVMAVVTCFTRDLSSIYPGLKGMGLIFLAALFGITANQNAYFEGINLASTTVATAIVNLIPAVTFVIAFITRLEKINFKSIRSVGKIIGTIICVGGALVMALYKGPTLLGDSLSFVLRSNLLGLEISTWLLGCILLFASTWCWSTWLILQVPVTESCPDHLVSSAWTCFFGMLQSAVVALALEWHHLETWKLQSALEYGCCIFAGTGSALSFFLQAWCISERGPVFSAMFNPVCTICGAILDALFLHEDIYTGTVVGATAAIIGLYIVLWGKGEQSEEMRLVSPQVESLEENHTRDLRETLLHNEP